MHIVKVSGTSQTLFVIIFFFMSSYIIACNNTSTNQQQLEQKAMNELNKVLQEESLFIKVHAAEYLIWLGYPDEPRKVYEKENELHSEEKPYRIGIWRVLAQSAKDSSAKRGWLEKVVSVYADSTSTDKLHATETLAKLQYSPMEKFPEITKQALASSNRNLATYALWAVSYASDSAMETNRKLFRKMTMADDNPIIRRISAYVLRKVKGLSTVEWTGLAQAAIDEADTSGLKHSMFNTAFVTKPTGADDEKLFEKITAGMLNGYQQFTAGERIELALSLADKGSEEHLAILEEYLDNKNIAGLYEINSKEGADVRATAAYAILAIQKRLP